jgi:hypothetical protein
MQLSLTALASLATIVGTAISILALIQSSDWLVLTSLLFICVSIIVGIYAQRKRVALDAASIVIEGHSIDSLNIANLRRRVNRTFVIQESHHTVRIDGEDMEITWKYSGYSKKNHVAAMEFSIDSDSSTPFDKLDCIAYDLGHDPEKTHKIRPVLVGSEGISKKASVAFLEPLKTNEPFAVLLKCTLPRCVKAGVGYYTASLSFAQHRVPRCVVDLIFVGAAPTWMRVYETTPERQAVLVKTLPPSRQEPGKCEYIDVAEDRQGRSARVYMFWRDVV